MKRPMCVIGSALAASTWLAFCFSARQAMQLSAAALVTGLLAAALRRHRLRPVCAVFLTAAVAFALHARYEQTRLLPFANLAGETVHATALVTDAHLGTRTVSYTLHATFPGHAGLPAASVRVRTYGEMDYLAGDVLDCDIRLAPKEQPDWGLRHAADSLVEGFLEGSPQRVDEGFAVRRALIRLRERLRGNVYDTLHPATADVVAAMVLGLRDDLSSEVYSAVNRAGTAHLLAISGLHLSIVAAIVRRLVGGLPLTRRTRALLTILAVLLFAGLVGFSASIIRSSLMTVTALAAAGNGRRRGDALSALGFAAAVICLVWPDWVLGRGFWLSAGATLGIVLFSRRIKEHLYNRLAGRGRLYNKAVGAVCEVIGVSLAASVFTLPLLVLFTGWVSVIAPLSNLLVAPFVPVVILGGMLAAAFGSGGALLQLVAAATNFCTAAVLQISRALASLPFATIAANRGWMLIWFGLALAVLAVLLCVRADRRLAGYAATMLVMAFAFGHLTAQLADRGRVELAAIEGCDAVLLLCDGDAVILGTPQYYEMGRLLRYLEYRGVRAVRAVVATDHGEQVGSALPRLAERYPVDCIIGPNDAYILSHLALAVPEVPVYSGGYAELGLLGGAKIEVLTPGGDLLIRTANNTIFKTQAEYAIIESAHAPTITIHPDNAIVLDGARGRDPNPVGAMLFGEQRWMSGAG